MCQQLQGDRALTLIPVSSHTFVEPAVDRTAPPLRKKLLVAVQGGCSGG